MKTVLVTGAAGFIGSALAKTLVDNGNQVITVDNLSTGFEKNIPKGVRFIKGNCQDSEIISILNNCSFDAIFHIAGQSSGEISFDDPVYDLQTNTQSTLLLLQLALKTGCKKFIYASTMSVYGEKPDVPVKEDVILKPLSFYGVGKVASEHYLRIYQQFGINTTALRLFNVYGPGQNMENLRQGMVSIFIAQAINNKQIIVKGSPDRYRDFIQINDVVNAFIAAYNRKDNFFLECNISTGVKTTVGEILSYIKQSLPFDFEVKYSDSTPGDQHGIVGAFDKAKQHLRWEPKVPLEEGLKKMYQWAIENDDKKL